MPTLQSYQGSYLWNYIPSLPLAIVFASLFGLATAAHAWKLYKTRQWLCYPFVLGGLCETFGYAVRAYCTYNTGELVPFLLQDIFLVIPPIFFAASLYMVYSRIVRAVHCEALSPISLRWATKIFIIGDLSCLSVQGNAAGLLGKPHLALTGAYIIIAGLILQIMVFVVFLTCCVRFNRKFRAHVVPTRFTVRVPYQICFNMLYSTSAAILLRNLYRVVEFSSQAKDKYDYLLTHEWPLYAFDAALMLPVMIVFFVWYPDQLSDGWKDTSVELLADGVPFSEINHATERGEC